LQHQSKERKSQLPWSKVKAGSESKLQGVQRIRVGSPATGTDGATVFGGSVLDSLYSDDNHVLGEGQDGIEQNRSHARFCD
jgi:hypothetical protein